MFKTQLLSFVCNLLPIKDIVKRLQIALVLTAKFLQSADRVTFLFAIYLLILQISKGQRERNHYLYKETINL